MSDNRGDGGDKPPMQFKISSCKRKSSVLPASPVPVETMSIDFSRAKICVLWDMVDCPIPAGDDPVSIYQKIKSALANKGYGGEDMEIRVYGGEKNTISEETLLNYLYAGIYFEPEVSRGTHARVYRMLRDILFWILDNPEPSNLMVISKNISEDTTFRRVLQYLKSRDHNVLFVQPHKGSLGLLLRFLDSLWLWKNLLDGEDPIHQSGHVGNTSDQSGCSQGVANKQEPKKRPKSKADTDSKVSS